MNHQVDANAKSSMRAYFALLWAEFKKEWLKKVVVALVAIVMVPIVWVGHEFYERAKRIHRDFQNISQAEALGIARQRLGTSVVVAVPFVNNATASEQFIAVFESGEFESTVHLLRGAAGIYETTDVRLKAHHFRPIDDRNTSAYAASVFGVVDVNNDGNSELYAMRSDGGTGQWWVQIEMVDTATKKRAEASAQGDTNATDLEVETAGDVDAVAGWRAFMSQKLAEFRNGASPSAKTREVPSTVTSSVRQPLQQAAHRGKFPAPAEWQRNHGKDFVKGPLKLSWIPGEVKESEWGSVECVASQDDMDWIIIFKGPVLMYDKKKNAHAVMLVDADQVREMALLYAGDRYVWLGAQSAR